MKKFITLILFVVVVCAGNAVQTTDRVYAKQLESAGASSIGALSIGASSIGASSIGASSMLIDDELVLFGPAGPSCTYYYYTKQKRLLIVGSGRMYDYVSSSGQPWADYREEILTIIVTDSIASIGDYSFCGCINAGTISISSATELTSLGNATFKNCSAISQFSMPNKITIVGRACFYGCSSLTSVKLSSALKTIERHAFKNCNLLTLAFPNKLKTVKDYAFASNKHLAHVEFGKSDLVLSTKTFYRCTSLGTLDLPLNVKYED